MCWILFTELSQCAPAALKSTCRRPDDSKSRMVVVGLWLQCKYVHNLLTFDKSSSRFLLLCEAPADRVRQQYKHFTKKATIIFFIHCISNPYYLSMSFQQWLRVGLETYETCSHAFVATLLGRNDPSRAVPTTRFYLEIPRWNTTNTLLTNGTSTALLEEGETKGTDWIVLIVLFLVIHTINWCGRWCLWEPFASRYLLKPTRRNTQKFSAIATAFLFGAVSAVLAGRILVGKDWLWNRSEWSVLVGVSVLSDDHGIGVETDGIGVEADVKFFYLLYAARYLSDFMSFPFEVKKSDTWAFAIHHAATIGLVLGSALGGYVRIGCVFLFFLDWSDVVLAAAKLSLYMSKDRKDIYQVLADRLFEVFAVAFLLIRNVWMNYVVYVCVVDFDESARLLKAQALVLVVLMTYWMAVIVQHVIHKYSGDGSIDDLRERESDKREEAKISKKVE